MLDYGGVRDKMVGLVRVACLVMEQVEPRGTLIQIQNSLHGPSERQCDSTLVGKVQLLHGTQVFRVRNTNLLRHVCVERIELRQMVQSLVVLALVVDNWVSIRLSTTYFEDTILKGI